MEFLVAFAVTVPEGTPSADVVAREEAEAAAAGQLIRQGHLIRLWKRPLASGGTRPLGLYRADSQEQLDGLLGALPLADWMDLEVTPLQPHPNDPGPGPDRAGRS
ncbi:MAG TPA: muconolactone Delta-isomerase family protein [Solirubrobacteraceae bacterium]|jgi:muconolactone D-isomerase|nr:muconolactone Delta-isomerase family protein [Solirubrobacteraceae bacterium]